MNRCYYYVRTFSHSALRVLSQHEWMNIAPAPWVQAAAFIHGYSMAQECPRDAAQGHWLQGCALPHWDRCPAGTHGCEPHLQVVFALMPFANGKGMEVYKGGHVSHGWAHPFPGCNISQCKLTKFRSWYLKQVMLQKPLICDSYFYLLSPILDCFLLWLTSSKAGDFPTPQNKNKVVNVSVSVLVFHFCIDTLWVSFNSVWNLKSSLPSKLYSGFLLYCVICLVGCSSSIR